MTYDPKASRPEVADDDGPAPVDELLGATASDPGPAPVEARAPEPAPDPLPMPDPAARRASLGAKVGALAAVAIVLLGWRWRRSRR